MSCGRFYLVSFLLLAGVLSLHAQESSTSGRREAFQKAQDFYNQGLAHQQNDQLTESIVLFDSAIIYNPNFTEAHFSLASSYEKAGKFEHALIAYQKTLLLRPDFTGASFRKAVCNYQLKMYQEAIDELSKLIMESGAGKTTNAVFYRYSESDGLNISTDNQILPEYYLYRGLAYGELHRPGQALQDLDSAVYLSRYAPDYLVNRGLAHQKLQHHDRARADYVAALEKDPENQTALLNLFTLNPELAKVYLSKVPDFNSSVIMPELLAQQAYLAYLEEDYSTSLSYYNQALKLKPYVSDWVLNRGLCLAKTGQIDQAETEMLRVLQHDDHSSRAYLYLGNLYFLMENFEQAISFYNQFIALEPSHSSAYLNRGLSYERTGKPENACRDLQRAFELGEKRSQQPLAAICSN